MPSDFMPVGAPHQGPWEADRLGCCFRNISIDAGILGSDVNALEGLSLLVQHLNIDILWKRILAEGEHHRLGDGNEYMAGLTGVRDWVIDLLLPRDRPGGDEYSVRISIARSHGLEQLTLGRMCLHMLAPGLQADQARADYGGGGGGRSPPFQSGPPF